MDMGPAKAVHTATGVERGADPNRGPTPMHEDMGHLAWSRGHRDYMMRRFLALADALAVFSALTLMGMLTMDQVEPLVVYGFLVLPVWTVLFKVYGLYERDEKKVSHSTFDDLPWLFHAVVVGSLVMGAYYALLPGQSLDAAQLALFAALVVGFVSGGRFLLRQAGHVVLPPERVLFVGADAMTAVLSRKMSSHPEYGLEPFGYVGDQVAVDGESESTLPRLGSLTRLEAVAKVNEIDRVMIAADAVDQSVLLDLVRRSNFMGLKVSVLPNMHAVLGPSVEVDSVEGVTVLGVNPPMLSRSSRILKRGVDLAVAVPATLMLLPLMLFIALTIRLSDGGPALFRQRRIGRDAEVFTALKFRTMATDAEERRAGLLAQSKDEGWLHLANDPRITRVGRFLRHYSLDELPQLWNVIRGEMSIVGPRPLIEREDQNVEGWGRRRLDLTPGITGLWQVLGRTNIPFEEMVKLDYLYVTNWSLWGDLRIIAQTLPVMIRRRGAN